MINNICQDGADYLLALKEWNQKMRHDLDINGQIWFEGSTHRLEMSNTIVEKAKAFTLRDLLDAMFG